MHSWLRYAALILGQELIIRSAQFSFVDEFLFAFVRSLRRFEVVVVHVVVSFTTETHLMYNNKRRQQ